MAELEKLGHETRVLGPEAERRWAFALPFYPEITLEFLAGARLGAALREFQPDAVHIATEGPMGWSARRQCRKQGLPFTTAYHTRFPEYLAARAPSIFAGAIAALTYRLLRRFHAPASAILVATASIEHELQRRGFFHLARWSRGVDAEVFRPYGESPPAYDGLPRPILLNVGRIAPEKNLRRFLDLETPGSKVVIGDGPDLAALKGAYPDVHFLGAMTGVTLARHYSGADLFVFPSTTDTFGLVLLEASSAGLRIAAMPAPGPLDIFASPEAGAFVAIDADLGRAVTRALQLPHDPATARAYARGFSWEACTQQFLDSAAAPAPARAAYRWKRLARLFAFSRAG